MRCGRCAGLVVAEQFIGGATSNGGWVYGGWRCVNCGAIDFSGQAGAPPALRGAAVGDQSGRDRRAPATKIRRQQQ